MCYGQIKFTRIISEVGCYTFTTHALTMYVYWVVMGLLFMII